MLAQRIITALFILPVVLVALFAFPNWAWDVFTLGIAIAALWEWSRFCGFTPTQSRTYFALSAVVSAGIFFSYLNGHIFGFAFATAALAAFVLAGLFWLLVVPVWLGKTWVAGVAAKAAAGWVVVFPTWIAFLQLHDYSPWMLLSFALIVWVADVFAYFVGKAIGKHKLAPAISPGKTIEGAIGAIAGVGLYYFAWIQFTAEPSRSDFAWARDMQAHGLWLFALFMLLAVLSIIGDLFESWMKRGAGLKDSSNLLPGHGGVLDRIDALTSTLPVAGLTVMLLFQTRGVAS